MRGYNDVIALLLLFLMSLSLAVIVQGVIMTTVNRNYEMTDFRPLPKLLEANGTYTQTSNGYTVNLRLTFTNCEGLEDAQVTLVGYRSKPSERNILGVGEISYCNGGIAQSYVEVPDVLSFSSVKVYVWKIGLRTDEISLNLVEEKNVAGTGTGIG